MVLVRELVVLVVLDTVLVALVRVQILAKEAVQMDVKARATELALMAVREDVRDVVDAPDVPEIAPILALILAPTAAEIRVQDHAKVVRAVPEIAMETVCSHATEHALIPAQIHVSKHAQLIVRETVQDVLPRVKQIAQETVPMIV